MVSNRPTAFLSCQLNGKQRGWQIKPGEKCWPALRRVLVALFQTLVFLHARSLADEAEDKMKAPVYRIVRNTHCGIIINVASKYVDLQML